MIKDIFEHLDTHTRFVSTNKDLSMIGIKGKDHVYVFYLVYDTIDSTQKYVSDFSTAYLNECLVLKFIVCCTPDLDPSVCETYFIEGNRFWISRFFYVLTQYTQTNDVKHHVNKDLVIRAESVLLRSYVISFLQNLMKTP